MSYPFRVTSPIVFIFLLFFCSTLLFLPFTSIIPVFPPPRLSGLCLALGREGPELTGARCAVLTLVGIDGVLGSPLLFWSCFRCAAAFSACTLPPRTHAWKITLFAARGLLMSVQHCLAFVLGFQCWRVDSQGDESKLRSIEVRVRGPTLPATRSNHQVGYVDNRV